MPSFLTQCPHCLTSFRVTDTQLEAADGLVRCGACLGVFSAAANRITVKPTPEEAAAGADSETREQDADELYEHNAMRRDEFAAEQQASAQRDDDVDDDDDEAESEGDDEEADIEVDAEADIEDDTDEDPPVEHIANAHASAMLDPDPEAEPDLLDTEYFDIPLGDLRLESDDELDAELPAPPHGDDEFADDDDDDEYDADYEDKDESGYEDEDEVDSGYDDDEQETEVEDPDAAAHEPVDVSARVYEEYLDEDVRVTVQPPMEDEAQAEEFEPEFTFDDEDEFVAVHAIDDETDAETDDADDDEINDEIDDEVDEEIDDDKSAIRNYLADLDDDDALDPLDDEALEFDEPVTLDSAPRRSRLVSFALLCANLLLVLLLAWQYADANIERLSRSAGFTPWLPYACRVLDCPAPERSQPEFFVSEQLLVRSHPRYAEALEVNLVFRNDAAQAQPFPALELGLRDAANRLLANRLFQPGEYLPAELNTSEMPARSSLQVTLELVDPGSEAVNYSLGFRAP